jgi:hypothetical protein
LDATIPSSAPTRLRLPRGAFDLLGEQVCHRHPLRGVDELLFRLRQVSSEASDAAGFEPHTPVRHVDVLEHIGHRELGLLALRGLVRIRREGRDIDEPGHARISPGVGDERAAIRVPDEDRRAVDRGQASLHGGDIARERIEAVLGCHHFVALGLQRRDQPAEA